MTQDRLLTKEEIRRELDSLKKESKAIWESRKSRLVKIEEVFNLQSAYDRIAKAQDLKSYQAAQREIGEWLETHDISRFPELGTREYIIAAEDVEALKSGRKQ